MERLEILAPIETPEQVGLTLELAGPGGRYCAYSIDLLCQLIAIVPALFIAVGMMGSERLGHFHFIGFHINTLGYVILDAVTFVVNFGYFAFFELIWRGQTPGKRLFGLRVVRAGGFPLTPSASLLRNLLRTVDILPLAYLVGIATMLLNDRSQRVGDLVADTWVVREGRLGSRSRLSTEPDSDASLAADFLARRWEIWPWVDEPLARELAAGINARQGSIPSSKPIDDLKAAARLHERA